MTAYADIKAVNWSTLRAMRTSPKHYRAAVEVERPDTDAFRLGRAVHTAVLEADRFVLDYAVQPDGIDRRTKAGKETYNALVAANEGKTILTLAQYTTACRIRDAVRGNALAQPLLASGKPEQVLQWTDERTGIKCKGRADLIGPTRISDIKTSRHAIDKRKFIGQAYSLGYYHQLAFYSRAFNMAMDGYLIAVEPTPPYDVAVYKLDDNALWAANNDIDALLARLAVCLETDTWPGVFDSVQTIEEPGWVFKMADDDDEEEAA